MDASCGTIIKRSRYGKERTELIQLELMIGCERKRHGMSRSVLFLIMEMLIL